MEQGSILGTPTFDLDLLLLCRLLRIQQAGSSFGVVGGLGPQRVQLGFERLQTLLLGLQLIKDLVQQLLGGLWGKGEVDGGLWERGGRGEFNAGL